MVLTLTSEPYRDTLQMVRILDGRKRWERSGRTEVHGVQMTKVIEGQVEVKQMVLLQHRTVRCRRPEYVCCVNAFTFHSWQSLSTLH